MTRLDVGVVVAVVAWPVCEGCSNLDGRVVGGHGGSASALRQGHLVNGQGLDIFFVLRARALLVLEARWWVQGVLWVWASWLWSLVSLVGEGRVDVPVTGERSRSPRVSADAPKWTA
jgi:hypothetical protein